VEALKAMNLDQVLATIKDRYPDETIAFLVDAMASGDLSARKQLADKISMLPCALPPLMLLEVSAWGVNDSSSRCAEIQALA
jgi:hypothetical protein